MIMDSENSKFIISIGITLMIMVSYTIQYLINKQIRRQDKIESIPVSISTKQSMRIISGQLLVAGFIVGSSFYAGDLYFEMFAGGYLLSLLVGIMLSIQTLLYFRGLSIESSAEGKIKFSISFGYKNMAHRLFSAGVLLVFLYIIFGNLAYIGGVLITWSTAIGYVRRSNQNAPNN
jgi:hypothetical protein